MRKTTILLLLLTLCISTAAFADAAPQLGSGARSDGPMVGSGVGDTSTTPSPRAATFFTAIRLYLGI